MVVRPAAVMLLVTIIALTMTVIRVTVAMIMLTVAMIMLTVRTITPTMVMMNNGGISASPTAVSALPASVSTLSPSVPTRQVRSDSHRILSPRGAQVLPGVRVPLGVHGGVSLCVCASVHGGRLRIRPGVGPRVELRIRARLAAAPALSRPPRGGARPGAGGAEVRLVIHVVVLARHVTGAGRGGIWFKYFGVCPGLLSNT